MRHRSRANTIGEVMHRRGKRILLVLLCLAAMPVIQREYQVQEIFVALLALGFGLVVVLLLIIAFVLLHDGVRRAAVWMKTCITRFASANHLGPREPSHPAHASVSAKH